MANQDRVNFVWAESALTTIPPIPVSEVAYRDTTQTPEQMEVGQQYDTIYNSARHNQLLFLITSVAKTLCENGMMPFLAGQAYEKYARCIFTDGKIYSASRAIVANESPYPTPGDNSFVWIKEGGGGIPAGSVLPFYNVNLGGPNNRNPIFWGQSEPDTGWLICDGGSDGLGGSVLDMRGKFIMGANGVDDAGQTGGAGSATPTITVNNSKTSLTVDPTTLTNAQMTAHDHSGIVLAYNQPSGYTYKLGESDGRSSIGINGGSQSHHHSVSDPGHTHTASASPVATLPPYYKLIYCVKLPAV